MPGSPSSKARPCPTGRRGPIRLAVALGSLAVVMACSDSPADPRVEESVAELWVMIGDASDQGLLLSVEGDLASFVATSDFQLYQEIGPDRAILLLIARTPLSAGEMRVGSLTAPLGADATKLEVRVVEVAGANYALREDLTGYSARLTAR